MTQPSTSTRDSGADSIVSTILFILCCVLESMVDPYTNVQRQPLNNAEDGTRPRSLVAKLKHKCTRGIRITLVLSIIVHLIMLVIGGYGVNKCPVNEYIPLFLIATGGVGLVSKCLTIIREQLGPHIDVKYIETSLYSVEIVFFILGSYWVYKEYQPSYDKSSGNKYCEKTVYQIAFIYVTALYAVAAALLSGFVCFLICIIFIKTFDTEDPVVDAEAQTEPAESGQNRPQATA